MHSLLLAITLKFIILLQLILSIILIKESKMVYLETILAYKKVKLYTHEIIHSFLRAVDETLSFRLSARGPFHKIKSNFAEPLNHI